MPHHVPLPSKNRFWKILVWSIVGLTFSSLWFILWSGSKFYFQHPAPEYWLIIAGRAFGLLAQFLILSQFVLISRFGPLERLFGFDHLTKLHRVVGEWMMVVLVLHPVLLILGNARLQETGWLATLGEFLYQREHVLLAFIGVVLFVIVIVWSLAIVRKGLKYEQWYIVHLLLYAAMLLSFLHQLEGGDFRDQRVVLYWWALAIFTAGVIGIWRFARPLWYFFYHRFRVHSIIQETPDSWSVYITGRNLPRYKFTAGQHAGLRFLNRSWWQSHPFSFSAVHNGHWIRFTIKASGDFTSTVGQIKPGTPIILDGPLGQFTLARRKTDKPLFIAGGIGITPLRAMIEDWVNSGQQAILLYGVKTINDIALRKEFAEMEQGGGLRVVYVLGTPVPGYESGFIDRDLITRLVPDFYDRDVFLCGPPMMMKAVSTALQVLGLPKGRIHFEEFSL